MRERPERVINLAGLQLPLLDTVIIAVTTVVLLTDHYADGVRGTDAALAQSIDRAFLFGVVPLAVLLLLRERPFDYGLRLGSWRVGIPLTIGLALVATPLILVVSRLPEFAAYYHRDIVDPARLLVTNALDVGPAEFLFRGFLMFTLVRRAGPIGVVLATFPFVFTHLGKPALETYSTLLGGTLFGWMAWRTGSVLYAFLLHLYILTLIVVAASALTGSG
jgi:membrane protease YdiL (CAAX protease family)